MNNLNHVCPFCEQEALQTFEYADDLPINGVDVHIEGLHASKCSACNEVSMSMAQVKENNRVVARYKAQISSERQIARGRLQAEEIRQVREGLGLTQRQAAQVFGGGEKGFSKYERGDTSQSDAMDRLLRLTAAVPEAADWMFRHYGSSELAFNAASRVQLWHDAGTLREFDVYPAISGSVPVMNPSGFGIVVEAQSWEEMPRAAA